MSLEKIAVMGAGSLGTILGAYLAKAGKDVTLVDAYEEHVKALNEKGATVVGKANFHAPVKAVVPEKMEGAFDLFIYMTKQTYNQTAIPQMIAHCHKNTIICCCQNGIPEMAVAKFWPENQICGAPVGWGATFLGPGMSELTTVANAASFHLGSVDGKIYPWILEVKEILSCMCETTITSDLMSDRWTKLVINAAFSGMSTVTGGTFGAVMRDDVGIQCLAKIGNECYLVAKAAGYTLGSFTGLDFGKYCAFTDKAGQVECQNAFREKFVVHYDLLASMLQDLSKGRKCEIAEIDGVVAETGDKYGIDTPVTDMVIRVVTEIEEGKRTYCFDNLKEFLPVL
mgnify:CR=1 FL=1